MDRSTTRIFSRIDFHRSSGRSIEKRICWLFQAFRAEIEPRQSAAHAPTRRSNRVAINQLDPGHERNLLLLTPLLPPLCNSTLYSRAHEITSRLVNYRDLAVSVSLPDKRLRRIARVGLSNISNRSRFAQNGWPTIMSPVRHLDRIAI